MRSATSCNPRRRFPGGYASASVVSGARVVVASSCKRTKTVENGCKRTSPSVCTKCTKRTHSESARLRVRHGSGFRRPWYTAGKKPASPRTCEVEAPGIEPGSERLPAKGTTRVSRSGYVGGNLRACNRSRPRPYVSIRSRRLASRPDPAGADVRPRYPALTGGRAALRPREPLARSRFCVVAFLRGLVTNHGARPAQSILRRNQFAPMAKL